MDCYLINGDVPRIMEEFNAYKARIPVYGAVILDTKLEKVLLGVSDDT
ncbi:hypothetical protein HaLaN_29379 [Haematococcus lacustris]|uniref:Uncharacterized protein n=1 Tax=Haematococcus lacustris TaxID=44745 RepID=A0A6A0AF74_HAELA|nr:hypothetical protein HaLaN_29379 [Haematococcus lacustris]